MWCMVAEIVVGIASGIVVGVAIAVAAHCKGGGSLLLLYFAPLLAHFLEFWEDI